jgi:hypothetical protein
MSKDILDIILSGLSDKNIRFDDLRHLLSSLEFKERIKGEHHIFNRKGIMDILNLQPLSDGKAKSYQVKQVRCVILKYKLHERRV